MLLLSCRMACMTLIACERIESRVVWFTLWKRLVSFSLRADGTTLAWCNPNVRWWRRRSCSTTLTRLDMQQWKLYANLVTFTKNMITRSNGYNSGSSTIYNNKNCLINNGIKKQKKRKCERAPSDVVDDFLQSSFVSHQSLLVLTSHVASVYLLTFEIDYKVAVATGRDLFLSSNQCRTRRK